MSEGAPRRGLLDPLAAAALPAAGIAALGAVWEAAALARRSTFLPGPGAVLAALGRMVADGTLPAHAVVSAARGLAGFAVAAAVGVPAGVWLGHRAPRLHAALEPVLRVLAQVNPFALMSVFLLVFGGGETAKVMAVAWVALWPILFCTLSGVAALDLQLVKAARAAGAGPGLVTWGVALPAAAAAVFAGLRLASALVFFVLVAAEMLGAARGLGWFVHSAAMNYQVTGIYAGALAVMALGFGLQLSVRATEERLLPRLAGGVAGAQGGRVLDLRHLRRRHLVLVAGAAAAVLVAGWAVSRRALEEDRRRMAAPAAAARAPAPAAEAIQEDSP